MNLQKNLRFYRKQAGYKTAKEFADVLGIPYNTYTAYENQKREPKLEMLIRIADILEISLDELVGRTAPDIQKRLRTELTNILSVSDTEYLKIIDIDDNRVTFGIYGKNEELIDHFDCDKKELLSIINSAKNKYNVKRKMETYRTIAKNGISTLKNKAEKDINDLIFNNKKEINIEDKVFIQNTLLLLGKLHGIDKTIDRKLDPVFSSIHSFLNDLSNLYSSY